MHFFEDFESIAEMGSTDIKYVAQRLAQRYMADNPSVPVGLVGMYDKGFHCDKKGRFQLDFDRKYPDAAIGSYAYAYGFLLASSDCVMRLSVICNTEAYIYVNGVLQTQTGFTDECCEKERNFDFAANKGKNFIFVKCRKNLLGFGCSIGNASKWTPIHIYVPLPLANGQYGMAYTDTYAEDVYANISPDTNILAENKVHWYPESNICENLGDVLPMQKGIAYALTYLNCCSLKKEYAFQGFSEQDCQVCIDGNEVFSGSGKIEFVTVLSMGEHFVAAKIINHGESRLYFTLTTFADGKKEEFSSKVQGVCGKWLCTGMLCEAYDEFLKEFHPQTLLKTETGYTYWRANQRDTSVRVILRESNFGRWNYPLGVVLYGFTEAGKEFENDAMLEYANCHLQFSARLYDYSVWDTQRYGFPCVNQQVSEIDTLDDCGSFANAVLNYNSADKSIAQAVFDVAHYMKTKQERLNNGMFYRETSNPYHYQTVWADDMYMSLPFLCRYYEKTTDSSILDDVVNQVICFRDYLFMPQRRLMSHTYSVHYDKMTAVPWGRGNGWALFTLTEVLRVLPEEHAKRMEILSFYRELSEGFYKSIDKEGMLHQVLDDWESYKEASCTAMCIAAFARGWCSGWLRDRKYADAAVKMWYALCRCCIRYNGDLYGVCQGSGFSFRTEYYKNELPWRVNDTHGVGIVLIAAAETQRLKKALEDVQ